MASYLRMQAAAAAAADPEPSGRAGQTARQNGRKYQGQEEGKLERQHDGQLKRQGGSPDTYNCCRDRTTARSVDVQSLQVSGYSCTMRESGLMGGESGLVREEQSQAASMYCSVMCLIGSSSHMHKRRHLRMYKGGTKRIITAEEILRLIRFCLIALRR